MLDSLSPIVVFAILIILIVSVSLRLLYDIYLFLSRRRANANAPYRERMYSTEIQRPSTRFNHFRQISNQRYEQDSQRQNVVEAPSNHNLDSNRPTTNRISRAEFDARTAVTRNDSIIANYEHHEEVEGKAI